MTTADEFAERLLQSSLGFVDVLATHLGDRLGWYRALAAGGPATPAELVARAGGSPRYAQEWLEQQATTGVLTLEPDGRFRLPDGPAEVLTDADSLSYLAPMARMLAASAAQLPALLDAYRNDGGVSWADFGVDMRESQADMNRPWFLTRLASALGAVPELDAVLRRPDALVADVGCGAGWSTIAIARAYPNLELEGWDVDRPSIDLARANGMEAGVEDRVRLLLHRRESPQGQRVRRDLRVRVHPRHGPAGGDAGPAAPRDPPRRHGDHHGRGGGPVLRAAG